ALAGVPGLFENPRRRGVLGEGEREEPQQVEALERALADQDERLRDDATTPEWLAQPVADLGGKTLDVGTRDHADAAHRFAIHFDRELRLLSLFADGP